MKSPAKALFIAYLLILLWLVLFKFSYDIFSVLLDHQARFVNLIPFVESSRSEMISNFIVFIPFGLLLCIIFKVTSFWQKLAVIFSASLMVETFQYIFAIGVTDVTDLLTNTLGGLAGLTLYALLHKFMSTKSLDRFIVTAGWMIVFLFLFLRLFIFQVRY